MRVLRIGFIIATFLALSGCIKEDLGDCPTPSDNIELLFDYTGDTDDPGIFARTIDDVTLFIYSAGGERLVTTRTVSKAALNDYQGVILSLDPGDYKVVCWGNADALTEIRETSSYSGGRLNHPNFLTGTPIPTNDHLYFGEAALTVPRGGTVTAHVPFRSGHVDLEIYVRGLGSVTAGTFPSVEVRNLMPQYDFAMGAAQPFGTTYYPPTVYDGEKQVFAALLRVLRFPNDNPIVVAVSDPAGNLKAAIPLKDHLPYPDITLVNEARVTLLVEFTDLGVSVTAPDWEQNPVTPASY